MEIEFVSYSLHGNKGNGNYARTERKYGSADAVYAIMGTGDSGKKVPIALSSGNLVTVRN